MPMILFVCTVNMFRSAIAEAAMKRLLLEAGMAEPWSIASAGTWTEDGLPAHPKAIKAANGLGLDLSRHRSRMVKAEMMAEADLIVVMHQGHKEALQAEFPECRGRIALLGELAGERALEIPDPANTRFTDSEGAARMIVSWTEKGFGEMVKKAASRSELRPG